MWSFLLCLIFFHNTQTLMSVYAKSCDFVQLYLGGVIL